MTDSDSSTSDFTVEFVPSPVQRVALDAAQAPPPRSSDPGWARAVAVAATAPALVLPLGWLLLSLLWRFVAEVRSRIDADGNLESVPSAGGRTIVTFLGHLGRALRPGTVLGWLLWTLGSVAAGIVATGLAAGSFWVVTEGTAGAVAAMRGGGLAYGLGAAAWLGCLRIVRSGAPVGEASGSAASTTSGPPLRQVVTFVVVAAVALGVTLTSAARTWWPVEHGGALVTHLPAGLSGLAGDLQLERIDAQVEGVVDCISEESAAYGWTWSVSTPDDEGDQTVLVAVDSGPSASRGDLAALAVALTNQLPASVYEITIRRSRALPPLVIDRALLRHSWRPFRDSAPLARAASVESRFLPMSEGSRERALTCSAQMF